MKKIKLENNYYKEIWYHESGEIEREYYYNSKDELHRLNGPAYIWYHRSGEIDREDYIVNGKRHRLDDPAVIWYYEPGEIKSEYYYINNKMYSKEEFYKQPEVIKLINIERNLKLLNKV